MKLTTQDALDMILEKVNQLERGIDEYQKCNIARNLPFANQQHDVTLLGVKFIKMCIDNIEGFVPSPVDPTEEFGELLEDHVDVMTALRDRVKSIYKSRAL